MVIARRGVLRPALAALMIVACLAVSVGAGSAQEPRRGGTLTVAYHGTQRTWNPGILASAGVFIIGAKVLEPLIELSYEGDGFKPVLATSWSSTDGGRTITFTLRKGVKWHDGKDFTSADVAFSALEVWAKLQNYGRVLFKSLAEVQTPDAHTAVFKFKEPMPLQLLVHAASDLTTVMPRHLYHGTDILKNPLNFEPIGTGPFRMVEYKRGQHVILERNPNYWDAPKPYLDRIVFREIPERAAISAALEAGEVQLAVLNMVPLSDLKRLGTIPHLELVTKGYEGSIWHGIVEFNLRRPELQDLRVRRAIYHALDVDFVVKNIYYSYGARPGTSPVPSLSKAFYTPGVRRYEYDPKKAERLLDEAGYKRGPDGTRFKVKLLAAPWFETLKNTGEYVKQALKRVGIQVDLRNYDMGGYLQAVYKDHDFDLTSGSWTYRNDPAISTTVFYRSGAPDGVPWTNQFAYKNADMDTVIDRAVVELNPERRVALYHQFQKVAMDDLPIIPFVEHGFVSVANKKLRAHHNNPRWFASSWADLWVEK